MVKNTKKRNEILKIIKDNKVPITAQEIYNSIYLNTSINLSTIYRTLDLLTNENIVIKEIRDDKKAYYQINNNIHKHRIICTKCNSDIMISNCPLKELENAIEKETGYKLTSHTFELRGLCPNCKSKLK